MTKFDFALILYVIAIFVDVVNSIFEMTIYKEFPKYIEKDICYRKTEKIYKFSFNFFLVLSIIAFALNIFEKYLISAYLLDGASVCFTIVGIIVICCRYLKILKYAEK